MSFRRYEIILPTRYNDGTPVATGEFWEVAKELVARFGATSYLPEPFHGIWIHQGQTYEESNVRLFVDVEDTPESAAFFQQFKSVLKGVLSTQQFSFCGARLCAKHQKQSGRFLVPLLRENIENIPLASTIPRIILGA